MSGFAVIFEQSNTPVEPGVLERVMDRLSHRGPDGRDVKIDGHVAMGHWHFWTTPEEVNERQPFGLNNLPFRIVLDGRIDNRDELISKLGLNNVDVYRLSDAALMLHAYARWKEKCFEHFIGEYAVVIYDRQHEELICTRDALGDRTLFYSFNGTRLVIASEPWAVAGAENSPVELDERAVAHYFALKATEDGQSLFKNIIELLPAHVMTITSSGSRIWKYWEPNPAIRLSGKSDNEYAEMFRSVLEESVRCRLRSISPIGVLMSGGLDSTSVACTAARMIAPDQLTTISYVFDEFHDCDERKFIEMVKDRWHIRSIQIGCDDLWPYKEVDNYPIDPNFPNGNIYRMIMERVYNSAHKDSLRVLLTGNFGDELYSADEEWLADLISDGHYREAYRELIRHFRLSGIKTSLKSDYLRHVGRRFMNFLTGRNNRSKIKKYPDWLTPLSIGFLKNQENQYGSSFSQRSNLLGLFASQNSTNGKLIANYHTLELRYPYRDRRLIEFVLSLPAYQLYNLGFTKYILRRAMQDTLPMPILSRSRPTNLLSLYNHGLKLENGKIRNYFQDPKADWAKYIRPDWLMEQWEKEVTPQTDGPSAVVPWLCISYSLWSQKYNLIK